METIFIYNLKNLDFVEIPIKSKKHFEDNITLYYPLYKKESYSYTDTKIEYPKAENSKIREMTKEELYKQGKYSLASNERLIDGKIKAGILDSFEYIEDNKIKFKRDEKIESIKTELSTLKVEFSEKEFLFKGKYLQKNRERGDRDSLTGVVVLLMATNQNTYDGWKVLDKETGEHVYLKLTLDDLRLMALHMQEQVTKAMKVESKLISKLNILSDDELKTFDSRKEYESLWS